MIQMSSPVVILQQMASHGSLIEPFLDPLKEPLIEPFLDP